MRLHHTEFVETPAWMHMDIAGVMHSDDVRATSPRDHALLPDLLTPDFVPPAQRVHPEGHGWRARPHAGPVGAGQGGEALEPPMLLLPKRQNNARSLEQIENSVWRRLVLVSVAPPSFLSQNRASARCAPCTSRPARTLICYTKSTDSRSNESKRGQGLWRTERSACPSIFDFII